MRHLSRTVAVTGLAVLLAGAGPASVVWAAPGHVPPPRHSAAPMPAMPGMDAGSMTGMTPAPTESPSGSMPGMDDSSMPGMTDADTTTVSRPRALVLGGFGVFNAGVLVAAALVRRRTAGERDRRAARRAAGRDAGTEDHR
jgi:uncharacterized protein involved in copper resistance